MKPKIEGINYRERLMNEFLDSQKAMGMNLTVVFYMVDALHYFKNVELKVIQLIAHEIAWLGQQGYNPNKGEYTIRGMPGKTFTGYHILAYYYVSWAIGFPEFLHKLQPSLPYEKEYELAKMFNIEE